MRIIVFLFCSQFTSILMLSFFTTLWNFVDLWKLYSSELLRGITQNFLYGISGKLNNIKDYSCWHKIIRDALWIYIENNVLKFGVLKIKGFLKQKFQSSIFCPKTVKTVWNWNLRQTCILLIILCKNFKWFESFQKELPYREKLNWN